MAEELYFKINSDVSSAVKGTKSYVNTLEMAEGNVKELNEGIKAQNELILIQEQELLKLEEAQSKIGKNAWNAGAIKRKEDIRENTFALKQNRLGLKELKQEQKSATSQVKSFKKEQKETSIGLITNIKNFKVMGFSINGLSKSFKGIIPAIRLMFTSIKVGIASTGIGLLVVALGGLVAWFTQTKAGSEGLSKALISTGAAVQVFIDRYISYSKMIFNILTLDWDGISKNGSEAFKGLGDELEREIKLAGELAEATNTLTDKTRTLNVETAQRRADIQDLTEKSQDLNLTESERLAALEQAGAIEKDLMARRVDNAEEALRIQVAQMTMSDNMAADLDKLADLEINLANIRRESSKTSTTLLRKSNAIRKSVAAEETRRQNAWIRKQNTITRANIKLKEEANEILFQLSLRKEINESTVEKRILRRANDVKKEILEKSKLDADDKRKALKALNDLLLSDELAITDKYDAIKKARSKKLTKEINDLNNENYLLTITKERTRLDKELAAEGAAEIKALDLRKLSLEAKGKLSHEIQEKYKKLRQINKDEEAAEDKQRADELAAYKTELLEQGLGVVMQGIKIQEQALTKSYKKDMKLAEANGKSTEKIEKDYQAKMVANAKKQKAMKIGLAIVDTYQSAVAAYNNAMAIPVVGTAMAPIAAGLAVAAGLANVAMIQGTDVGGGGGGGGGGSVGGGAPDAAPPAPQMMSGSFDISGGVEPEPLKAFVVTDEMTSSQDQLANIRRRATI